MLHLTSPIWSTELDCTAIFFCAPSARFLLFSRKDLYRESELKQSCIDRVKSFDQPLKDSAIQVFNLKYVF